MTRASRTVVVLLLLTSAFAILAPAAFADEEDKGSSWPVLTYGGTDKIQYTRDTKSDTRKTENEFILNLGYGDFSGYFRISNDLAFPNRTKATEFEKAAISWRGKNISVTAGDFSAIFANGLSLNVFEAPEIDYDTEPTGGKADFTLGATTITVLAGEFKTKMDQAADTIEGAHVEVPIGDTVSVGGSYVKIDDKTGPTNSKKYTETGGNVKLNLEPFEFTGEFVNFDEADSATYPNGTGWIVAGTYYGKNWSMHGGYYDYDKINSPYTVPATFKEHPEKGGVAPADEVGYGAKVTWSPRDWGTVDVNWAQSNFRRGGFPYTETVGTWTLPALKDDTFQFQNRYYFWVDTHNDTSILEWQHAVNEDWTSTLTTQLAIVDDFSGVRQEHRVAVAADYQDQLTLLYEYELAQFKYPTTNRWDAVTVRYNDPGYRYDVQFRVGSQRAGFNCAGGVCQLLPEFKGFELTVNLYF